MPSIATMLGRWFLVAQGGPARGDNHLQRGSNRHASVRYPGGWWLQLGVRLSGLRKLLAALCIVAIAVTGIGVAIFLFTRMDT